VSQGPERPIYTAPRVGRFAQLERADATDNSVRPRARSHATMPRPTWAFAN